MKLVRFLTLAAAFSTAVYCADIPLPFNTGVQDDGTPAATGATDSHYSDPTGLSTVYVSDPFGGAWLADDGLSRWVSPDTDFGGDYLGGYYSLDYRTTFDLTGYDPSTVTLSGQWSTDNIGDDILINGVSTGNTSDDYSNWYSFTISDGFVSGINTLDFLWTDQGAVGGVRVEFTSLTGDPITTAASAPEPSSMLLMGAGAVIAGMVARRRQKKA